VAVKKVHTGDDSSIIVVIPTALVAASVLVVDDGSTDPACDSADGGTLAHITRE